MPLSHSIIKKEYEFAVDDQGDGTFALGLGHGFVDITVENPINTEIILTLDELEQVATRLREVINHYKQGNSNA